MPAYIIVQGSVSDPQRYEEYKKLTPETLKPFQGEFLLRGNPVEVLEGVWEEDRLVILAFPTKELAKAWYTSEAYQEAKAIRKGAAQVSFILSELPDL